MYLLCYGRSEKAHKTGSRLLEKCEGEWIRSIERLGQDSDSAIGRVDAAIVLILPLTASVKLFTDKINISDVSGIPVYTVDPAGRYAGALRHGGYNSYEMLAGICEMLDCKTLSDDNDLGEIAPDLKKAVEKYSMIPSDPALLDEITEHIAKGGRVNVYSDMTIDLLEPTLDHHSYIMYPYRTNQKKELVAAYLAAGKDERPSIFITCTPMPEQKIPGVLVLTPKRVIVGLELTARTDPDYAVETVKRTLVNHGINPKSCSTIAVSAIVKDSDAVKAVADSLGCYVTSFDSRLLKAVMLPLAMTYSPSKNEADTCTAAACLASDNGNLLVRRAGEKNTVLLTAAIRKGNIALTE